MTMRQQEVLLIMVATETLSSGLTCWLGSGGMYITVWFNQCAAHY